MKKYYFKNSKQQIEGEDYSLSYRIVDYRRKTFDFNKHITFYSKCQVLVEILGWRIFKV